MRSLWFLLVGFLVAYHCIDYASAKSSTDPAAPTDSSPTFSQCKPYVDAALKGGETTEPTSDADANSDESGEDSPAGEPDDSKEDDAKPDSDETPSAENDDASTEDATNETQESVEDEVKAEAGAAHDDDSKETNVKDNNETEEQESESNEDSQEQAAESEAAPVEDDDQSTEAENNKETDSEEAPAASDESGEDSKEDESNNDAPATDSDHVANDGNKSDSEESQEEQKEQEVQAADSESTESTPAVESDSKEDAKDASSEDTKEEQAPAEPAAQESEESKDSTESTEDNSEESDDSQEEQQVLSYVPRSRENLEKILGLDDSESAVALEGLLDKATQTTLKDLKTIYETAIKPLETTYKYRDLSNRHFGDPEIFSKPLVVFMGPWSGGKSTIINWLSGIENHDAALRTGADPSPAQFNILTHGKEDEVLDGTQLAADWTFSGLQKFGQTFLDRLRGRRLPNRLLEKINLVEIPGILEVRKQVERSFPFNDACQWFIDRADVLFLVYDPAKLDIGPETEAILDQLKGRESQIRIVLNKADSVKPDELLRLQANLIWNISPLMASAEPPTLYVASLWGRPLNPDSPTSLLLAHENSFLKDIREATERRVETRIAAARRFAVRVRNHAKMCDCYLNTYNNHRSFFSNKKKISDDIIDHPQNYHIYEGLSTLRNISRYDLPDPDTYKDFFRLNPLWEFPTLASTCTYFRGCPINKLDIAIAYDLPELLGKYRRQREAIISAPAAAQQQQQQQAAQPGKSGKKKN